MSVIPYYIYNNVKLGQNVSIHPFAVIGKPPQVPSGTTTYKPRLGRETVIGDNCVIGAGAVIYEGCTVGSNTLIGDGARLRDRAVVGDHCIIGMGTKVGPKTVIQSGVKIMDLCNIAGNMLIEIGAFISQGVMCANDKYMGRDAPESVEDYEEEGPTIRQYATIGANATLLPGVEVGENSIVGAGALVVSNVAARTVVINSKAVYFRDVRETEIKGA